LDAVICRPLNGSFYIGWRIEQGSTEHPWKEEGELEFGLAYLRHMIDQGLSVAYAVSEAEGGLVHLKAWEKAFPEIEYESL